MDSIIYAAAAKASTVEFFYRPSIICNTFSFFSRKTVKAQHKLVLLFTPGCYVGEALSTAQRSCQLALGLANPGYVLGA